MEREPMIRQNGAAIRALRKKDKRTVADVAAYAGLKPQTLTNIENNSKPVSKEAMRLIAELLDVPVAAITRCGTDDEFADDEDQGARAEPAGVAA
jgi:transcriptional regulator with XRE-family HTH domain